MQGQIALWILSRFAMLFFIFSLAAAILVFGNRQRDALCSDEATRIARALGSTLNYVINSPIEDERKVHALEPILAVGREDFARYAINITHFIDSRMLRIEIAPLAWRAPCSGAAHLTYPEDFKIVVSELRPAYHEHVTLNGREVTTLYPAGHQKDFKAKSRYLIVIKCGRKKPGITPRAYIILQNCGHTDAADCINFETYETTYSDWCAYR